MKHLYNNYGSWKIYSVKHKTKHKQIEGRKIIRQHFSVQSYRCQFSTIVNKIREVRWPLSLALV